MSADDVRTLTRVPITFEVAGGGTEHAPMVVGRLGGVTTRLVLDTGSEVHLLTKELVDDIGLTVEEGEQGTDHSGATMPSWAVEDVALELGGVKLTLRDIVAIPAPPPFPGWDIGGILSPQHLHPRASAVVDLVADELVLVDGTDAAVAAWLEQRSPAMTTLEVERDEAFASVVVAGAIRPHAEIPTMLNTGGRHTEFSSDAVPGVAGADLERLGGGVTGADVFGAKAGKATLVVAGREVEVPSLAVRTAMHDPPGLVGMDVLRGTILTVRADARRPVLWQTPGTSPSRDGGLPHSRAD
ncbi:MAG: retropepsin-like domain-containing protein [Thermoleophilia bacterium]|nr:retropepsin-like domain-containing protein [Thermoleophilia bacterium]